ncbi:MAG: hypothetical protein ACLQGP_10490 [Isosphaeraceae bacterium]
MRRPGLLASRWILAMAIVLILIALVIWTVRPEPLDQWLGAEGLANHGTPLSILRTWFDGRLAPMTPGGFLTLFPRSELFILIALLASLGILMFLLAAQVRHRRTWAWLTRSIPRLRLLRIGMRVGTTMILIAILGLDLGWEIVAWRNWRLRERYLGLASSYRTSEAANRDSLHRAEIQIARLDADSSMGPEEASWTPAAQAAVRAFSRDIWHRNAAIATGQAAHYADLKQKYERAAADPSRPVPPDPPPPDEPQPHLQGIFIWPGKYDQALADCDEIIRRYSDLPWVHRERAWILATCPDARIRDGKLAVAAATRAAELTNWKDWTVFPSLAAAYAEAGDFANAVRWEQRALEAEQEFMKGLPPNRGGIGAPAVAKDRLALYKAGKPFRMGR